MLSSFCSIGEPHAAIMLCSVVPYCSLASCVSFILISCSCCATSFWSASRNSVHLMAGSATPVLLQFQREYSLGFEANFVENDPPSFMSPSFSSLLTTETNLE